MKLYLVLAATFISVSIALDLETVQKNSQRRYGYPLTEMGERKMQTPTYLNTIRNHKEKDTPSRFPNTQQHYRRFQELLANVGPRGNRGGSNWFENSRQPDVTVRRFYELKPVYNQGDFPANNEVLPEEMIRWAPPLPQLVRPRSIEKRPDNYLSHKQLSFSTRVPQEEIIKKRSFDSIDVNGNAVDVKKMRTPKNEKQEGSKRGSKVGGYAVRGERGPVNATGGNKTSSDQFQRWLTDEYYHNMAMSFATMRKKRSTEDQPGDTILPATTDEALALHTLRRMEQSLLQDALCQLLQKSGCHSTKAKTQIAERLHVAHDIESLKKDFQNYITDAQKLKGIDDLQITTPLREAKKEYVVSPSADESSECPEVQMLSNGCTALRGILAPSLVQGQFIFSCSWHEVCYACGGQHGISVDQCDESLLRDIKFLCGQLGTCDPQMIGFLIEPLHKKRNFLKRNFLSVCEKPCILDFLARP